MKGNTPSRAGLLWDESFIWGLISFRALREKLSVDFELLTSDDIRAGRLSGLGLLYVPGGWASNKMKALGKEGAGSIREFVAAGGCYMGICGGAGLATSEGLGLLSITRRPLKERVPSLSGRIRAGISPHPAWNGIRGKKPEFHIWWPSQFVPEDPAIKVLARFEGAADDAFSSDISVKDVQDFAALEEVYGLNLDPGRMLKDPLVLEGGCGRGKVLASLIHFDTPGDRNGLKALGNLFDYFGVGRAKVKDAKKIPRRSGKNAGKNLAWELMAPVEDIFRFGERNFLWFRRGWLIQWRRGVRGLEYFTLYEMARELAMRLEEDMPGEYVDEVLSLAGGLSGFGRKAKRLLMLERMALQEGEALTFSRAENPEIQGLRMEMFSNSKSHGGEFKALLDKADRLLYALLK